MTLDRKAARKRCEAAAEGPWQVNRHDNQGGDINWQVQCGGPADLGRMSFFNSSDLEGPRVRQNAELIAHARTDLPAALGLIDRCEAMIRQLESAWLFHAHDPDLADEAQALLAELGGS
jgi:hypothetical protein